MPRTLAILGVPVHRYSRAQLQEALTQRLTSPTIPQDPHARHLITLNPEFLVRSTEDTAFKAILQQSWCNICDGAGIQYLAWSLSGTRIERIPGVEVAEMLCHTAEQTGRSLYLLGGAEDVNARAVQALQERYPSLRIVGHRGGDRNTVYEDIIALAPDVLLVCYPTPAQHLRCLDYLSRCPSLRIAGGFGGTVDFWAGAIPRAPQALQSLGLEWLYRLYQQPHRWQRIVNAVIRFPLLSLREKLQKNT
ncbi:WecB/TagA/CpsF family glycosyltransferase [Candidatus Peribacteria bacterium]|nr:WecB/TagA/CpsF family glycosyltransferase [Candidatus Peribacteria bacterium]